MSLYEKYRLRQISSWVNDIEKYVEEGDKKDRKYVVYGLCEIREIVNRIIKDMGIDDEK
jgi:hypothetical protein